jgi:hypothetical protein
MREGSTADCGMLALSVSCWWCTSIQASMARCTERCIGHAGIQQLLTGQALANQAAPHHLQACRCTKALQAALPAADGMRSTCSLRHICCLDPTTVVRTLGSHHTTRNSSGCEQSVMC